MEHARTCIGCRVRADKSVLLRVVARDGVVIPDPSATLPGRGAWVHPTSSCVENSIKRRAFGRALRVSATLDTAVLSTTAWASSEAPGSRNEMAD
ncbi:MAG TPA: YlxR family protein [Galbitalea sp.]